MSTLSDFCPSCGSYNLTESLEPETSIHYGRVQCSDCDRFIRWMSKPKVQEISIVRLLHSGTGLEAWEKSFLKAVACRTPTKAESIVIQAIQAKINPVSRTRGSG